MHVESCTKKLGNITNRANRTKNEHINNQSISDDINEQKYKKYIVQDKQKVELAINNVVELFEYDRSMYIYIQLIAFGWHAI